MTPHLHPLRDLRPKLQPAGVSLGVFLVTGNSMLAEACSLLDFGWVVIDMEAGPFERADVLRVLQALSASGMMALVRVPALERHHIEHVLDIGADGVIIPKVESCQEADEAVAACYFPPKGRRGVNPIRASGYFTELGGYFTLANCRTVCAVQIETKAGLAAAGAIAAVDGVDVVFVGVGDLAMSLGHPGEPDHPTVLAACSDILEATLAAGKVPGIFAYSTELARHHADEGFRLIAVGNEIKFFMAAASAVLADLEGP
jgi:2-keto-3-deoxy-L-rhamnonate aldolase RhmA